MTNYHEVSILSFVIKNHLFTLEGGQSWGILINYQTGTQKSIQRADCPSFSFGRQRLSSLRLCRLMADTDRHFLYPFIEVIQTIPHLCVSGVFFCTFFAGKHQKEEKGLYENSKWSLHFSKNIHRYTRRLRISPNTDAL